MDVFVTLGIPRHEACNQTVLQYRGQEADEIWVGFRRTESRPFHLHL